MKVLVVEDELPLARTIRRGLNDAGFTVDLVHDGGDGVWAATESPYDAIVLDLMLPTIDGHRVLELLRERGVWTPVLVLTARHGSRSQAAALDIGADDYLTKPFDFVVLVAHLRALIRRGAPARPVVLRAGDLSLDPARRRVRRGDTSINLTSREFAVLEYLVRHSGEVVSKSAIMANVWDANYEGEPNIVEVYVRYLRRKIDLPFGRQSIQTVRGAGYRLSDDLVTNA